MSRSNSRRALLAAVATGFAGSLAGCTGFGSAPNSDSETPPASTDTSSATATHSPTRTPVDCETMASGTDAPPEPAAGFPRLSASASVTAVPDVETTATVTRAFTADHPAEFHVSLTNTTVARRFDVPVVYPFGTTFASGVDAPGTLQLVPEVVWDPPGYETHSVEDTNEDGSFEPLPDSPVDGCWRADDEVWLTDEPESVELGPCERIDVAYRVVAHPESESCLAPGTYRAESMLGAGYAEGSLTVTLTVGSDD